MFNIEISDEEQHQFGEMGFWGQITIGDFNETFFAPSVIWTSQDYRNSWENQISRLMAGNPKVCLFTSFREPAKANFLFVWKLYIVNENVIFQNQVLFIGEENYDINGYNCHNFISDYSQFNEDNLEISSWQTTRSEVEQFYLKMMEKGDF